MISDVHPLRLTLGAAIATAAILAWLWRAPDPLVEAAKAFGLPKDTTEVAAPEYTQPDGATLRSIAFAYQAPIPRKALSAWAVARCSTLSSAAARTELLETSEYFCTLPGPPAVAVSLWARCAGLECRFGLAFSEL